ncbi:MAG: hypothetical protein U1F87_07750 [Kiritimatiellia bacterium]
MWAFRLESGENRSQRGRRVPSRHRRGHLGRLRRLQQGDEGGHYRRALAAFPLRELAEKFMATYFRLNARRSSSC